MKGAHHLVLHEVRVQNLLKRLHSESLQINNEAALNQDLNKVKFVSANTLWIGITTFNTVRQHLLQIFFLA